MIGGNTIAVLQVQAGATKNKIGERNPKWVDVLINEKANITGWFDLQSGDSKYTTANAKMQESTHIFLCDYVPIPDTLEVEGIKYPINAETTRMVVNLQVYDVMLIDDPMSLHQQLEIYLKYTGGQ